MPEPAAQSVLLDVRDLNSYYGESHVLQGCTLSVGKECVAVLGRNGMGKTTLMRSIMGLTPPRSGQVLWNGKDLAGKKPYDIASQGLGYVPQGRCLFPSLSVEEHLTLTYRKTGQPDEWTPKKVFDLFPEIARRRSISGARLSGGEDRVVEICRELLKENISILLVEQNIHVAEALADRVYILVSGKTVHDSTAEKFLEDVELRQKYLGV